MNQFKIARSPYQRATQTELGNYVANVVTRMQGAAAYQPLQKDIEQLAAANDTYLKCLAAARNRGLSEVYAKDTAKATVLKALSNLVAGLEKLATDPQMVIDAGFTATQASGSMRYSGQLDAPIILKAVSTGRRGELRMVLEDAAPKAVLTHAIEVSYDQGQTWHNGQYHNHRSFKLTGLRASTDLWVKVAAIGTRNNKSDWSEPLVTAVL